MAETSATAEGDLRRTPFAHLLVYALDHELTGVVFLTEPSGVRHAVQLERGVPVKVRPGDQYSLLGEMLLDAKVIDRPTLDAALATGGLLGSMLVLTGRTEHETVEKIAEQQFVRRMVRLFALPRETTYAYFDGHTELSDYGGDPAHADPLALLWAGLSAHGERSAMMDSTLSLLGDKPLRLHASATTARFGLSEPESKLQEMLSLGPSTLAELIDAELASPGAVRRFTYALLITRQIDLGTGPGPLGSAESVRSPTGHAQTAVARMALRSTVHRVGAAAPDLPGDGERGPGPRANPRRPRDARADGDDAPVTERSMSDPVSAVKPAGETPASDRRSAKPEPPAPDPYAEKSPAELLALARERLAGRDPSGAAEACAAARRASEGDPDVVALDVWSRFQARSGDLKVLSVELDELLSAHPEHVDARFYRAMLRRRLSDEAGCQSDLKQVLSLLPEHADARRELAAMEQPAAKEKPSLFGRLFRR